MTLARKFAGSAYSLGACASIALGGVYLIRQEFMPYHSEAVGLEWTAVPPGMKVLLGALMNVVGSAWVVLGVVTLVLLAVPFRRGGLWAHWTIPVLLVSLYLPILAVTLQVEMATGAATPWHANAFAVLVARAGFLADRPWVKRAPNSNAP